MRVLVFTLFISFASCISGTYTHRQVPEGNAYVPTPDSVIIVSAGKHYKRGFIHSIFFGKHYRQSWAEPVPVRVTDLRTEKGGLTPERQGGSFQSFTLRLRNPEGHEYVMRSVDKDPSRALPRRFRDGYFGKVMRDQTSAAFPYSALVASSLADAAGVYHTNPEYVLIPHDSAMLGKFYKSFSGTLVVLEERADDDWSHADFFGNSEKIKGSENTLRSIAKKPHHQMDQEAFLRARLLDMLIGDWSRREDQWRWASFKSDTQTIYRPIPRDRDHALFRFRDGIFTAIAGRIKPNYSHFTTRFPNMVAMNKAGRRLDNVLLNELTREDWITLAEQFYMDVSPDDIDDAIETLPSPIIKIEGKTLEKRLLARRGRLRKAALEYYDVLSEKVAVQGTAKADVFKITTENGRVVVTVTSEENVIYRRAFNPRETKEIHLLGLDGDDRFIDQSGQEIALTIYGGVGQDFYESTKFFEEIYDDQQGIFPSKKFYGHHPGNTADVKDWLNYFYFD